jgi:ATP-binding cassette subfamily B protein/subfamily B ATP-binding cassette protein MsbA
MDHFLRALREAWRYWPTLLTAFVFSLAAASLWGTNIAALFPIIETTLHGQSIPQWNRQRQVEAEREITALRAQIESLTSAPRTPAPRPAPLASPDKPQNTSLATPLATPLATAPATQHDKPHDKPQYKRRLWDGSGGGVANSADDADTAGADRVAKLAALEVEVLRARLWRAEHSYASATRLGPWLERYLPDTPFRTVVMIVIVIACATALKQILAVCSQMMVAYVSQSIARDIRLRIFDRALTLDRPRFNLHGTSGFSANITHTTEMLSSGITAFYHGAFSEPCRILACLAGAFYISWRLTLVSLIFAPLVAFVMLGLNRHIRGLAKRTLNRSLNFHQVMLEVFQAIGTVQAYTMEDFERERFRQSTREMRRASLKAHFFQTLTNPLTEVFGVGMLCIALAASAYLVINQETTIFGVRMSDEPLTISSTMVFFGMLIGAADPLRKLSSVISAVNSGMAASSVLYPILDTQSGILEPAAARELPRRHSVIEFRGVRFSYDGLHDVLRGVDLRIPYGEHLAIVGPNGGGKSTLISLLCRFFEPTEGEILVDGIPLKEVGLRQWRQRLALVTQQTELFNETVGHNIRYGRWDATPEEVIEAAKQARAHDFISALPDGYDTIVGPNGQRLSGGQRQRIALARAILRDAEILILDEATSQIDRESERLVHDALADLGRNRTLVMITHRESTLSLATRIVQVQHGETITLPLPAAGKVA